MTCDGLRRLASSRNLHDDSHLRRRRLDGEASDDLAETSFGGGAMSRMERGIGTDSINGGGSKQRPGRGGFGARIGAVAAAVAIFAAGGSGANAQDAIRTWDYSSAPFAFIETASPGDLDGDGVNELMVETFGLGLLINVDVYSGRSGSALFNYGGFGSSVTMSTAGDWNGDGRPDFLIGYTSALTGYIYSGLDGTQITSFTIGGISGIDAMTSGVDLNGDGFPDVVVAYENYPSFGVQVRSGADGSTLLDVPGRSLNSAAAGDLDGDSVADLWIAHPDDNNSTGSATAYSVVTKLPLLTVYGENPGDYFGYCLVNVGDVDGDGRSDVAVTAEVANSYSGRVYLYSGSDGSSLGTMDGTQPSAGFGAYITSGDLDGDGHSDLLVAAPGYSIGGVQVGRISAFSGADLSLLENVDGGADGFQYFGVTVCAAKDVDGDGRDDAFFASTKPGFDRAYAYSLARRPRITSIGPSRGRYTGGTSVTVTGSNFSVAETPTVSFGGASATNVVVIDDGTITCDTPAGTPGLASATVANSLGSATLDDAFTFTPAVTWDGSATPGGSVSIHYLCDPLDGILAIIGTDPASVPTPPFDGALGIVPFQVVFVLPTKAWPFDHFDLTGNVPNDPSLVGVTVLLQALDGPSFGKPKDATWTNVAAITIE